MAAIAFLPWVHCNKPQTLGSVRLLPYVRGELPGDLSNVCQAEIDTVLGAYATRPGHVLQRATLVERGDWETGTDVTAHRAALFETRDALAFSAIAKRELFGSQQGYTNSDTYSMVIQQYTADNPGFFSFTTRRRYGGATQIWSSKEFAFVQPIHVVDGTRVDIDESLFNAILTLKDSYLREAIVEFNRANSDSADVPEHVEMIMTKSAFEWLLSIGTKTQDFTNALMARIGPLLDAPGVETEFAKRWRDRWPKTPRLLAAWAQDFCDVRGAAAHGTDSAAPRFVWPARTHLAFASIFFPLLFKKILTERGECAFNDGDLERIQGIERLLSVDPYSTDSIEAAGANSHPWSDYLFYTRFDARLRKKR